MRQFTVAVVGATGAVGEEMLRVLEVSNFPVGKLVPLASSRSAGGEITFKNRPYTILELTETVFEEQNVEIALFSAGGAVSAKFASCAAAAGAVVIDNTSHYRMDPEVPLVVPEVNPEDAAQWKNKGIIANPNCSTIQMVQALKPIDELFDIQRVDTCTYQATSGGGKSAMEELVQQMQDFFAFKLDQSEHKKFPHQIALNVLPQIDVFMENGFTKEEMKMVNETVKIMHKDIKVAATCVRVPVLRGHSEALAITCAKPVDVEAARKSISQGVNLVLMDNTDALEYPMPITCVDKDETYVGRIRKDTYSDNILHMWVVADNLRVGAATNAVRIARLWTETEAD